MKDYAEVRYFETRDRNGDVYILRAERAVVIAFGQVHKYGPWSYKTVDGKSVRPSTVDDTFMLYPGNIRLMPVEREVAATVEKEKAF